MATDQGYPALLEPGHPLYNQLADVAQAPIGEDLTTIYLRSCPACKSAGVLCEEHVTAVHEVDGGYSPPPGYWQPAGTADQTAVLPAFVG